MSRVVVTGGNSGIGQAIVRRLVRDGQEVVFTYCHGEAEARSVADETGAQSLRYDLTSAESIEELASVIREDRFDGLINNASQRVERRLLLKIDPASFMAYQTAALRGVFTLSQAFAAQAKRRATRGAIVNILTTYTLGMPPAKLAAYVTSKYALLGLTRSMAVEFIRYGVRVNAVSPAVTRTPFIADLPDLFIEQMEASLPMERIATADEVSGLVRFLLSEEASYINGANIPVSGGQVC